MTVDRKHMERFQLAGALALLVASWLLDPEWLVDGAAPANSQLGEQAAVVDSGTYNFPASLGDRPLFSPTRKPWVQPEAAAAPVNLRDMLAGVRVTGMLALPNKPVSAWVSGGRFAEPTRVLVGDNIGDWTVKSISEMGLELVSGEKTRKLELDQ